MALRQAQSTGGSLNKHIHHMMLQNESGITWMGAEGAHSRRKPPPMFPKPGRATLKDVIQQLIEKRHALNLTQEEVQHRLGVCSNLVGKWECGARNPRALELTAWAATLGCNVTIQEDKNGYSSKQY